MNMCTIDKLVILKTDTIPYEVPLIHNNNMLIDYIRNHQDWNTIDAHCWNTIKSTVSYNFKVYKNEYEDRNLNLCHPLGQLYMLKFLEQYDKNILDYFKLNSGFSLRKPCNINSEYKKNKNYIETQFKKIFEKDLDESSNEFFDYIDSYFIKKPFVKITDFYSSYMLKNFERKYNYLRALDISKCFYNIYTHSIEWAILGNKQESKNTLGNGHKIGAILDKLIQYCNYQETNGIVVGPEFSRIIAEIILCRVDKIILNKLNKYKYKIDYDICRFMDDIFIFSNNTTVLNDIEKLYKDELFEFKLSINNDKIKNYETPFFEDQIWISELKNNLYEYRESFKKKSDSNILSLKRQLNFIDKNLTEITRILLLKNRNQIPYITSYIMSYLQRNLNTIINYIEDNMDELREQNIIRLIDFISYFITFNLTSNNIIKLCKIYITILQKYKNSFFDIEDFIYKKSFEIIKFNRRKFVDIQNIILVLTFIEKDLPENLLISLLNQDKGYFSLIILSFYVSTTNRRYKYKMLKQHLNSMVINIVDKYLEMQQNGFDIQNLLYEYNIILISDFYNSPIISQVTKNKIDELKLQLSGKTPNGEIPKYFFNFIKNFDKSFTAWNATMEDLTKVILAKTNPINSPIY